MQNKDPYEEKYGRHSNFRAAPEPVSSGLPLGKWLFVVFLVAFVVLGVDRWRKRSHEPTPEPVATETAAPLPAKTTPPPLAKEQETALAERETARPTVDIAETRAAHEVPANPAQATAAAPKPAAPPPKQETEVRYEMEKFHNHFIGKASINGKDVMLMADTGATTVVIPEQIAQRIGLKKGDPVLFNTAGGAGVVHYKTSLETLTLGRIEITNVAAVISPKMGDDFILLGMSALSLLDMQIEDGKMVLKHKQGPAFSDMRSVEEEQFKRSTKDCKGQGNKFDKQTLDCMRGR